MAVAHRPLQPDPGDTLDSGPRPSLEPRPPKTSRGSGSRGVARDGSPDLSASHPRADGTRPTRTESEEIVDEGWSLEDRADAEPVDANHADEAAASGAWSHERQSDWGSLLADLSRPDDPVTLRVHDRTHLEFLLDYDLRPGVRSETFEWEAYFFAPESLRLSSRTYDKQDIYSDLQSYVRFAVPEVPFSELAGTPLDVVRAAIESRDPNAISRELRLYASIVRASGVRARRCILGMLASADAAPESRARRHDAASKRQRALVAAERMIADARLLAARLRETLGAASDLPEPTATAARWIDEDVSRLLEMLLANLALGLRKAQAPERLVQDAERAAIAEARYREQASLDGIGRLGMSARDAEHLEFRRHVLKRFTSSVLWLEPEVREASTWVLHFFHAVAASVAMAFATAAAIWGPAGADGASFMGADFFRWAVVVILAYAAKDRIKALLQSVFSRMVARHFPDRSWRIRDAARRYEFARMEERSGFVPFRSVPADVLRVRRATRLSCLEEEARPETVLFHKKTVVVDRARIAALEPRYDAMTEVYRFDVRRWLAHTDDPKREFVFADPEREVIARAAAPRVYNIAIIYRLRRAQDPDDVGTWRRVRVVVSRKGIRRIETVA